MVSLGESSLPAICQQFQSGNETVRWVAGRALAARASPAAVDCLAQAARHPDPAVRADTAAALRFLIGRETLPPARAWALVQPLVADADPRVRVAAISAVAMFDFDHTQAALAAMSADPDAEVAKAAREMRDTLRRYRKLNPDLPY